MSRYGALRRIWVRLPVWLCVAIAGLLIDEYVKEGYWFKPSDVLVAGSHENLIAWLAVCLLVYVFSIVLKRLRARTHI